MSNIDTIQGIADTLFTAIEIAASALLNASASNAVGSIVVKAQAYVDLLAVTINRYQTVNNLIKNAQAQNRDLTPEEVAVAEGFYNSSLASVQNDLGQTPSK